MIKSMIQEWLSNPGLALPHMFGAVRPTPET